MSIATELENYRTGLTAAYAAAEAKGATIPEQKNLNNLSGTIESVPAGGGGLIEYAVDENGKMSKATVDFKLPSDVKDLGGYAFSHMFTNSATIKTADLSSLTTISGQYGANYMFDHCTNLTSVDLSSLTNISGQYGAAYMFDYSGVASVDLSSLATISGRYGAQYMFEGCESLTSIDLSSLTTISGQYGATSMFAFSGVASVDLSSLTTISGGVGAQYMFNSCKSLTSIDLSSLATISGSNGAYRMFSRCSNLTSVDLSSLTDIGASTAMSNIFEYCTSLEELRFPALTADSFGSYSNQFNGMLSSVTGCTLHFPAAVQAKIETMPGYPNFGGTNTIVLFDL